MINIDEGTHTIGDPIHVKPSDQIFAELGNNTYDYRDLLSELIDNSLAAMVPDQFVHVTITIGISDSDPTKNWLTVRDDASGIPPERLGLAITPAGLQAKRSLNEHGLGMKQAVAGLGQLRYLATKVNGQEYTRVVEAFQFGYIYPKLLETPWYHGTEVAIDKLKATVRTYPQSYTRDDVPYLGARYRRFVTHSNPRSEIYQLLMVDIDAYWTLTAIRPVLNNWIVQEVKPTSSSQCC